MDPRRLINLTLRIIETPVFHVPFVLSCFLVGNVYLATRGNFPRYFNNAIILWLAYLQVHSIESTATFELLSTYGK